MQRTAEIIHDAFDREPLAFTDAQLANLTKNISHQVIELIPGFHWWEVGAERKMNRPVNICGHVQRAWDFYWSIRLGIQTGNIVLGIGTGGVGAPGMFTTDKFCGESPHEIRYPSANAHSHATLDADGDWPYHDGKFGGVVFNHSFEHLHKQAWALREALRVTRSGGYVCILQPCMAFNEPGTIDPTHTKEWAADEFYDFLQTDNAGKDTFDIVTHNMIDTAFSFETVLRKR